MGILLNQDNIDFQQALNSEIYVYSPLLQSPYIFRLKFRHPALQILDRRQPALRFAPCLTKFYLETY